MQIFTLVCFWLCVFFVVTSLCFGDHRTVEVVGVGECADCKENNIKTSQAFSGLSVTVECKSANGDFITRGAGELDGNGNFKVYLPRDFVIKDGELKEECYAQLHSAMSATPCPAHDDTFHYTKIVTKSKEGGDHRYTLGPTHKLKFSSLICISTFFWPFFNHHPFFPKLQHPHNFSFPPINEVFPPFPPKFFPKHPLPPPVPIYKKPPPVPIGKKPSPPPPSPISKPLPSPPHPVPNYEPPFFKPLLLPPFPKWHPYPPLPKIPGKYFHQPKFGKWPPLPPFTPHS